MIYKVLYFQFYSFRPCHGIKNVFGSHQHISHIYHMANIINQLKYHLDANDDNKFIGFLNHNPNINLNIKLASGHTLLNIAAFRQKIECVKALVRHGANIDSTDNDGNTSLMLVSEYYCYGTNHETLTNYYHIIKFLIESGANCNIYNKYHMAPFIFICFCINKLQTHVMYTAGIISLFLDHGVDRDFMHGDDETSETVDMFLRSENQILWANCIRDYKPAPLR